MSEKESAFYRELKVKYYNPLFCRYEFYPS